MKSFLIGAIGYPMLEIAWRGRSHPSMALAGGLSTVLIHRVGNANLPATAKALLCGAGITAIEGCCGLIWNRHHQVWDYRRMLLNWHGQICLPYALLWSGLSAIYMQAERFFRH